MSYFARRYDALRVTMDEHLAGITRDLWWEWPRFMRWSVLIALLLVAALHLLQAITIHPGSVVGSVVVAGALAVAMTFVGLQAWTLWQTRLDATQKRPYVVALLLSALTISLCTEAFAGLTSWLWSRGWLTSHASDPSLWTAERFYLWHLLDSLPLLSVPETLGLSKPQVFDDRLTGALILVYKIVLIVPLVRLAVSGYELMEVTRLAAIERADERQRRQPSEWSWLSQRPEWKFATFLLAATAAVTLLLPVIFDPASPINRWLDSHLKLGITIAGARLPLAWLQTAPQWAAVVGLGYFVGLMADFQRFESTAGFRSLSDVTLGLLGYLALFGLVTLVGVALTLTLLHVGLVGAQPAIPPHAQVWAAINAYSRSIADAVPGLRIPETLHWDSAYTFTGVASGALFLLHKIIAVGVLVFPMARIVSEFLHRARPRPAASPSLAASGQFASLLVAVQSTLDKLEVIAIDYLPGGKRDPALEARLRRASISGGLQLRPARKPFDFRGYEAERQVDQLVVKLETTFGQVTALFGEGDVKADADQALMAALRRSKVLSDLRSKHGWRLREEPTTAADLTRSREDLDERIRRYSKSATAALRRETKTTVATPEGR